MSTGSAPAGSPTAASPAVPAVSPAALPCWPWRWAALLLAGAAQLITISDLVSAAPRSWLLLAIAPAPVAAAAAFAPAPVNLLAAVAVLVVGVVAQVTHVGVLFVPSLAALAVKLRREQPYSRREGAFP